MSISLRYNGISIILLSTLQAIENSMKHQQDPAARAECFNNELDVFDQQIARQEEELEKPAFESQAASQNLPSISMETIRQFLETPYSIDWTGARLHAIYRECGHVREMANHLAMHHNCQPETLAGLYALHGRDLDFLRLVARRRTHWPQEMAQQIFEEHIRAIPYADFQVQIRNRLTSIAAQSPILNQLIEATESMIANCTIRPNDRLALAETYIDPKSLHLTTNASADLAKISIHRPLLALAHDHSRCYKVEYEIAHERHANRCVYLLGDAKPTARIHFPITGLTGLLLESEARNMLVDLKACNQRFEKPGSESHITVCS